MAGPGPGRATTAGAPSGPVYDVPDGAGIIGNGDYPETGSFGSSSGAGGDGGGGPTTCQTLTRPCTTASSDFPLQPVIDTGAPANAATYFAAADGAGAGPCIVDPTPGTLIPQNWLRPRFRVQPATGQNLFEITLTSTRQANPYIVYTSNTSWTMPKKVWDAVRGDSWGCCRREDPRGQHGRRGSDELLGSFTIAPALANGSMIYWGRGRRHRRHVVARGFRAGG